MVGWEKNRKLPVTKETNMLPYDALGGIHKFSPGMGHWNVGRGGRRPFLSLWYIESSITISDTTIRSLCDSTIKALVYYKHGQKILYKDEILSPSVKFFFAGSKEFRNVMGNLWDMPRKIKLTHFFPIFMHTPDLSIKTHVYKDYSISNLPFKHLTNCTYRGYIPVALPIIQLYESPEGFCYQFQALTAGLSM